MSSSANPKVNVNSALLHFYTNISSASVSQSYTEWRQLFSTLIFILLLLRNYKLSFGMMFMNFMQKDLSYFPSYKCGTRTVLIPYASSLMKYEKLKIFVYNLQYSFTLNLKNAATIN